MAIEPSPWRPMGQVYSVFVNVPFDGVRLMATFQNPADAKRYAETTDTNCERRVVAHTLWYPETMWKFESEGP